MNDGGCASGGVSLMTTVASHQPDYSMNIDLPTNKIGYIIKVDSGGGP
jgi:hypothetical protein